MLLSEPLVTENQYCWRMYASLSRHEWNVLSNYCGGVMILKCYPCYWPFVRAIYRHRCILWQRASNMTFDVSFDIYLNTFSNKMSRCNCFMTQWRSCDVTVIRDDSGYRLSQSETTLQCNESIPRIISGNFTQPNSDVKCNLYSTALVFIYPSCALCQW